jgi:PST family polysaccharide transporter
MMNRAVMLTSSAAPAVGFRILAIIHDDPVRFRIAYRKVLLATSFVAYPLLGVLIGLAPELFRLLFGPQWGMAVMPFQVLCVAGMMKTLNTLQSTAAQSTGQVWGEVKRQLVYLALIVVGAGIGSYWGLTGASLGVLAASMTMAVLMQSFLRRVTSLAWRDLIEPQVPALVCALAIAVLLWALRPWVIGQATTAAAAIEYGVFGSIVAAVVAIGFVRFAPFAELRQVTEEIVEDLFPALLPLVRSRG